MTTPDYRSRAEELENRIWYTNRGLPGRDIAEENRLIIYELMKQVDKEAFERGYEAGKDEGYRGGVNEAVEIVDSYRSLKTIAEEILDLLRPPREGKAKGE